MLEELARQGQKVPELVLAHRQLAKLKSTYVDALPGMVNPVSGRLHTNFLQTGAATGRLASKDPNLQNIPVREEEGRRIRTAFVPEPGWVFLSADYAQIELVILAHLSGDPTLREAFAAGRDVHRQTAALLFGVAEEEVSAEQRRIGKTINFGVIYGMSAFRLARDMRIPRKDAESFISTYFQRYAGVDRFLKGTIREAEVNGYVRTLMGRRRPVPAIGSRNRTEKMAAERVAVNSPIQGSAADIVKKAMLDVTRLLQERGLKTRLLLQVHDELIFEAPQAEAAKAAGLIRRAMEGAVRPGGAAAGQRGDRQGLGGAPLARSWDWPAGTARARTPWPPSCPSAVSGSSTWTEVGHLVLREPEARDRVAAPFRGRRAGAGRGGGPQGPGPPGVP